MGRSSPWISSVTGRSGETFCSRPDPWDWSSRFASAAFDVICGNFCPATAPMSMLPTRSRRRWQSLKPWPPGFRSWRGDIGPISELCDDGVEARFWSLDDPAHAAATLAGFLDCEPARAKAARAASERFHREFDADVIAPRLLSFLLGTAPQAAGAVHGVDVRTTRFGVPDTLYGRSPVRRAVRLPQSRWLLYEWHVHDFRSVPLAHDALSPVADYLMNEWYFITYKWPHQTGFDAVT